MTSTLEHALRRIETARYSLRSSSSSLTTSIASQLSSPAARARLATSLGVPTPIARARAISRWLRPCCHFSRRMVAAELSEKRINNILAVLSKPLKYAADCELIAKAPRIGMFKVERPEIEAWDFAQYARLLAAAKAEGEDWYAGVCLAGEAGLRVGEVKALRWREDVDMIARTLTVRQQTCNGATTTPKGRTRRTVPMTSALYEALKRMATIREGFVVRNLDGSQKTDSEASTSLARICRSAGLPVRYWHTLRHSFGTHAALFGVNPWRLQNWMGHKRIDETMLYVHVAEAHRRELPEAVQLAVGNETDPDARILKMLGARGSHVAADEGKSMGNPMAADRTAPRGSHVAAAQLVPRGSHVAAELSPKTKEAAITAA